METTREQQAFLEKHSEKFLKMALDNSRHEKVFRPDGYGKNTGDCGDTIEMSITTLRKIIQHISLEIDGCVNTNACANAVADLIEGKTTEEAWEISPEKVAEYLETLPEDSFHCAELAVGALFLALTDFNRKPVTSY
jgi:nitrogen fixation protein NifU and related proteins